MLTEFIDQNYLVLSWLRHIFILTDDLVDHGQQNKVY